MTRTVLTIAGSDSGGGAGIQADLKTVSALGCYGASVITAVTAQNTRAVTAVHAVPPEVIRAQIDAVLDDIVVHAIKIGMVGSAEAARAVAASLRDCPIPIVLDPVMIAKSGDPLLDPGAVSALVGHLLPLAHVLTPNLPEAARLLNAAPARDEGAATAQAAALRALGPDFVLLKGGHGAGPEVVDILSGPGGTTRLAAPRIATRNTHGTGCTLSSAIAAGLAQGLDAPRAARRAHDWLQGAIQAADGLAVGGGHGPVHHFHALWPRPAGAVP